MTERLSNEELAGLLAFWKFGQHPHPLFIALTELVERRASEAPLAAPRVPPTMPLEVKARQESIPASGMEEDRFTVDPDLATLHARIGVLEGALRPFADKATAYEKRHPVSFGRHPIRGSTQITHRLGDFRAARLALNPKDK